MQFYQQENNPIGFNLTSTHKNTDVSVENWYYDITYQNKHKIGILELVVYTDVLSFINTSWSLRLDHDQYGELLEPPYRINAEFHMKNNENALQCLLNDIAQNIIKYYEDYSSQNNVSNTTPISKSGAQNPCCTGRSIQIKNIYYSSNDPQHGEPTPVYEIEVRQPDDVHSYIKTILLHVTVYYDAEKQQFYATINTVRINGVLIKNKLAFDPSIKYLKLSSVYAYDQLKHIDFKEAIEEYLKSVSSWLDLCNKNLNSKLETK